MKKQVIAISVAAITALSLMEIKWTIKYKKKIQLQWKRKHDIIKYCDT